MSPVCRIFFFLKLLSSFYCYSERFGANFLFKAELDQVKDNYCKNCDTGSHMKQRNIINGRILIKSNIMRQIEAAKIIEKKNDKKKVSY